MAPSTRVPAVRTQASSLLITLSSLLAERCLLLVDPSNLESFCNELVGPQWQTRFWDAHHSHVDPVGQLQIKQLVSDGCIVLVELIEFALFEEYNRVPEFLLDFPILLLEGREASPGHG